MAQESRDRGMGVQESRDWEMVQKGSDRGEEEEGTIEQKLGKRVRKGARQQILGERVQESKTGRRRVQESRD